jgi:hypothetical protein
MRDGSRTVYALLIIRSLSKNVDVTVIIHNGESEKHLKAIGLLKNEHIINPSNQVAKEIGNDVLNKSKKERE